MWDDPKAACRAATLERRGATITAEIAALSMPYQAAWSSEAPAAVTPVAAVTPTRPSCTDLLDLDLQGRKQT